MYTPRPGVRGQDANSGGRDSMRPCEPSQYRSISCRRAGSAPEAAETDRLGPTDLHQQAVFDIEMGRSDRAWRGDEDEPHPVAHLALPADHPALELIERRVHQFGVRGIIFDVEQRKPSVGVLYVADNVTWPGQRAPRRASLGN